MAPGRYLDAHEQAEKAFNKTEADAKERDEAKAQRRNAEGEEALKWYDEVFKREIEDANIELKKKETRFDLKEKVITGNLLTADFEYINPTTRNQTPQTYRLKIHSEKFSINCFATLAHPSARRELTLVTNKIIYEDDEALFAALAKIIKDNA